MNMFNNMLNDRGSTNAHQQFVSEAKGDEVDFATHQKEQVLHQRLDQRNVLFLRKVAQAKQKILEGTYGLCEDCGCEINQKRLLARPTATLCIDCQEEKERGESALIAKRRDLKDKKFEEMDPDSHLRSEPKYTKVKDIGFESVVGD